MGEKIPSFSTYHQISGSTDPSYKLIQLPKDLVEYMKSNENTRKEDLIIKSPADSKNDLVLCTPSRTWKVRQMNHSNTVLLMNNMNVNKLGTSLLSLVKDQLREDLPNKLVGFTKLSYEYELSSTAGSLSTSRLPTYNGKKVSEGLKYNIEQFLDDSPISTSQFLHQWYQLGGSQVDGFAVVLTQKLITEILLTLIPILIANGISYDTEDYNLDLPRIAGLMKQQSTIFTTPVVTTILNKFGHPKPGDSGNRKFRLNNDEVSKWFGIQTLISKKSKLISPNEFLIEWKSSFPPAYNVPIELETLRGHYYRPVGDKIQYLNPNQLSDNDVSTRIKDLFAIVKEWDFDEFVPFVAQFVPAGKKADTVILKYARKKRMGKRFMVCPR